MSNIVIHKSVQRRNIFSTVIHL